MKISELHELFLHSAGVCTDSRKNFPGCIFFALKGENFDGNCFAMESLNEGAITAVVDDKSFLKATDKKILYVKNVLQTLQQFALYHRKQFKIPIIAITGTNGKTTTKELIAKILSTQFNVLSTEGNLNNHIGIPLTLLKLKKEHQVAVIEMGANHTGEIKSYCEFTRPTHGLITNIGKAHLEGFGGLKGVVKAKGELFAYIKKSNGFAFVNNENDPTRKLGERIKRKVTYAVKRKGEVKGTGETTNDGKIQFTIQNSECTVEKIKTELYGLYNMENLIASATVGLYFGIKENNLRKAFVEYSGYENRSQIIRTKNYIVIADCYNSNPSSLGLALKELSENNSSDKICVIGDMLELGKESKKEHQKIGTLLNGLKLTQVIFIGKEMKNAYEKCRMQNAKCKFWFEYPEECKKNLKDILSDNGVVLFKGSRLMKLEELVNEFKKKTLLK